MNRRRFLRHISLAGTGAVFLKPCSAAAATAVAHAGKVVTVTGPVSLNQLGFTLPHEHILVDFVGADKIRQGGYDYDRVASRAVPHLRELKALGVDTLVECTPAYIGRDPLLLKKLSEETGVQLVTNTGFYGARSGMFVPEYARSMNPRQLAEIWTGEAINGIGDSGIRPGFIKTAVNQGPLQELDRKLIRAAALTHRRTGLSIHSHTSKTAISGNQQLEILREEGVHPSAWIWVHANGVSDLQELRPAFEAGAWISFDNLRPEQKSVERMLRCLEFAKSNGWINQVLLSHDGGWYDPGKPDGGEHRPYTAYFTHLLAAVEQAGLTAGDLQQISHNNAAEAMKVGLRLL